MVAISRVQMIHSVVCSDGSEWRSPLFRIGAIPLLSVCLCLIYVQTRFILLY